MARVVAICVVLLIAVRAGGELPTIPQELERVLTIWDTASYYTEIPGSFTNYNACRAAGHSVAVCEKAVVFCGINQAAATAFGRIANILKAFQVDCGEGICFACCFTGQGCHTSFYDEKYKPVINCTPAGGYGPIARQAGPTLIVDPDAQPGDPCLFTEQTCDHLAACLSGNSAQEIERINNDPGHVIKSQAAIDSRARAFATSMLGNWSDFLSNYHTSSSDQSDAIRLKVHDFAALAGFMTGRGCAGWRQSVPGGFGSDWSDPQFRLADENGLFAERASQYNGVRQLGLAQLLSSVPNLLNRFAYVESRIWTPEAIRHYLAPIGDPDAALLRTMSPIALEILKKSPQLQDYRLLAVPLRGEIVPSRFFSGCTLGEASAVAVTYRIRGELGIEVQIAAAPGVETVVLWGDGSVTHITLPAAGNAQARHDYAAGGKYQVLVVGQNDSGLRTIAALVAQTASKATNAANAPIPLITEVQLVDVRTRIDVFAGDTGKMLFEMEGWPRATLGYALGISRALPVPNEATVSFGTIAGWNTAAAPLRSVTIRPARFADGPLFGMPRHYFSIGRVRVGVFSTEHARLRFHDVAVTADMVRLYPDGSDTPVALTQPAYDAEGRLQIPVQDGNARYTRVDLLLPQSLLAQAVQGPIVSTTWKGYTGIYAEAVPGGGKPSVGRRRVVRH